MLDPLQNAITCVNDGADRLTAISDPLARTSFFGYDRMNYNRPPVAFGND